MAGKQHHFLPQFLLRRFAVKSGDRAGLVWRADLDRQLLRQVAPKHEAAKRFYYRLPPEIELPGLTVEELLGKIETGAAAAAIKYERGQRLDREDREWLAFFLLLQRRRTPAGRRELRFMDEVTAKLNFEFKLGSKELARQALSIGGAAPTDAEVERWQQETLAQLRSGEIVVESTAEREVALMFAHLDTIVPTLLGEFDWRFIEIKRSGEFVLPDCGVTLYDPTPTFPSAATGLMSSPTSETVLHLSPKLVMVVRPGRGVGDREEASAGQIETLNLRAVADSERCIYGSSEEVVTQVLDAADANPQRIEAMRPRPMTLWIAEGEGEPQAGRPITFTGYSLAGTRTQDVVISQEGIEEARKHAVRVGE